LAATADPVSTASEWSAADQAAAGAVAADAATDQDPAVET
jgi:hypothetical protein